MRIDISTNAPEVADQLRQHAENVQDLRPVARQLQEVLHRASARQFASGAGWPRSEKASGLTLVNTGTLRESLSGFSAWGAVRSDDDSVEVSTRVPYAEHLARGARGMPKRDPGRVDEWRTAQEVGDVLADFLRGDL